MQLLLLLFDYSVVLLSRLLLTTYEYGCIGYCHGRGAKCVGQQNNFY